MGASYGGGGVIKSGEALKMQALQWRAGSSRWGLISSTDKLPCKTRSALSLDDPSRIINFGHQVTRSK